MHPFLIKTNTHWGRWREHAEVIFEKDEFTVVYNCGRSYLFKGIDNIAEKMQEVNSSDVENGLNRQNNVILKLLIVMKIKLKNFKI